MYQKLFTYNQYDEVDFFKVQFCDCVLKKPIMSHDVGDKFDFICIDYLNEFITLYINKDVFTYKTELSFLKNDE